MSTILVNLFAGPGTGKSTSCAQIFSELKWKGINCEMTLEYAKDKIWEESYKVLDTQAYIFGKQLLRIKRLQGKVDVIITDSPLLLTLIYDKSKNINFKNFVLDTHNEFQNINIFLNREKPYRTEGRMQTADEAVIVDNNIKRMLIENDINYHEYNCNSENVSKISKMIELAHNARFSSHNA